MRRPAVGTLILLVALVPVPARAGMVTSECERDRAADRAECAFVYLGPNVTIEVEAYSISDTPLRVDVFGSALIGDLSSFAIPAGLFVMTRCSGAGLATATEPVRCTAVSELPITSSPQMQAQMGVPVRCMGSSIGAVARVRVRCTSWVP